MTEPTMHAHYATESKDCDGRMDYHGIYRVPDSIKPDDDYKFERLVLGWVASWDTYFDCDIRLSVNEKGNKTITMGMETEEGFTRTHVEFCYDDCDLDEHGQRDHTAESMGY